MPDNKKHHYVPRFYLKRFSKTKKNISLYNLKNERKIINASLKDQCYKEYFYGKELLVESALADIENIASEIFRQIDKAGCLPPPSSPEHLLLIVFILMQYSRTKYSTDALNEMTDKMMKYLYSPMAKEKGLDLSKVNIHLNNVGLFSVAQSVQLYPILLDLRYKLLKNCTNVQFVRSDNPVVLYNQLMEFRRRHSNTGYANKGLQIFFPIDPHQLILLYDNEVYRVGSEKKIVLELNNVQDIYQINTLQVCSCLENIFFLDPELNCDTLHNKARPYLREIKVNLTSFPQSTKMYEKSEIIMTSREDIRTNLKLSFLSIRKSAKDWRKEHKRLGFQPEDLVRNKKICDDTLEFIQSVDDGNYKPDEFFKYLHDKYGGNNTKVDDIGKV